MRNPFAPKRRDPLEQALDALEDVRAEAAQRAAGIRDAAAQAVELLGEAAPEARRHRIPLALGLLAAGVGTAIALRARKRSSSLPPTAETPVPSAAATAAKSTAAPEPAPAATPAAEVEPEKPREPKAATEESDAASEEATR